jgi:hypothetical protein
MASHLQVIDRNVHRRRSHGRIQGVLPALEREAWQTCDKVEAP